MAVNLRDPWVSQVTSRSNVEADGFQGDLAAYLHRACQPMAGYTDAILEISSCALHKTPEGHARGTEPRLLVIFRFDFVLLRERGVLNKRVEAQMGDYKYVANVLPDQWTSTDGKHGNFDVQFVGAGNTPLMRLAWTWWRPRFQDGSAARLAAATERDRILRTFQLALA